MFPLGPSLGEAGPPPSAVILAGGYWGPASFPLGPPLGSVFCRIGRNSQNRSPDFTLTPAQGWSHCCDIPRLCGCGQGPHNPPTTQMEKLRPGVLTGRPRGCPAQLVSGAWGWGAGESSGLSETPGSRRWLGVPPPPGTPHTGKPGNGISQKFTLRWRLSGS